MKDHAVLVSVIIPVFNGEAYISEAIDSVYGQTWSNLEIIVIDDGSTDGTAALLARDNRDVRYVHQPNAGIGAARNRGLDCARGEYISFIDADDIWIADKLERQMSVFRTRPEIEMVYGHARQFHSPELSPQECARLPIPDRAMPAELPSALLCRREVFARVGPFDPRLPVGADLSWIMRARDLELETVTLPDVVFLRRLHRNNNANTKKQGKALYPQLLKAMLDRRRTSTKAADH